MTKRLKDIGEEEIVKGLAEKFRARHPRLVKAIGDDTSVTLQKGGLALLATTDSLIEDTHFRLSYTPPYYLGRKALSISISDIAAMGGCALFFLVSIAMPPDTEKSFLDEIYRGIGECAKENGVIIIGGNTAKADKVMISTTVLGEAAEDKVIYRSGARINDIIYVTGTLGDSALGLEILNREGLRAIKEGPYKKAVRKHLDPDPRIEAGGTLAGTRLTRAMMDISDGLALDLKRLCRESEVGATIELKRLPLSGDVKKFLNESRTPRKDLIKLALTGGEDYELLFTSPERNAGKLALVSKRLGLQITPVGKITSKRGVDLTRVIDEDGKTVPVEHPGFEHF